MAALFFAPPPSFFWKVVLTQNVNKCIYLLGKSAKKLPSNSWSFNLKKN